MNSKLLYILVLLVVNTLFAQKSDSLSITNQKGLIIEKAAIVKKPYNALAPSKAAFYSAVLPGLGQVYNKKYWKIPIVYAGMGVGVYFYLRNDKEYDRFRDAYKRRLAGHTDDEFWGEGSTPLVSDDRLRDAQKSSERNKSVSIAVTALFYLLNILDANVDAHLQQFNVNNDLTLKPEFNINQITAKTNFGMSLKYTIK